MYFCYGEREVEYLKAKDERLGEVIEKIGHVDGNLMDKVNEALEISFGLT